MRWGDLSPAQQAAYGNGVGPWWFPAWPRRLLTSLGEMFFQEADWGRHDFGYANKTAPRWICDREFLCAMLRDTSRLTSPWKIFAACVIAWAFWAACRLFGWASYGHKEN